VMHAGCVAKLEPRLWYVAGSHWICRGTVMGQGRGEGAGRGNEAGQAMGQGTRSDGTTLQKPSR
jgi:hypothetical protein